MDTVRTRCCIAGGGPAGIMLGYMLARAGIDVVVLEKWPDFFRDFRGDTIHPSTMQVLHELGLLEDFLKLPHNETQQMTGHIGGEEVTIADFTRLRVRSQFIAFIPQWDFLNFMSEHARALPSFHLMMKTEAVDVIENEGRVMGVRAKNENGEFDIQADLVIGADGRHSTIREKSQLAVEQFGAPIDVLWFSLARNDDGTKQSFGYIDDGKILVMLDRDTYWQCGYIIEKGSFDRIQADGIQAFRAAIAGLAPGLAGALKDLNDWSHIKLLSVTVDHLTTWHKNGLLCIGDSAHAMSPVGGIGINLAIQDAVAAANVLVPAFRSGIPERKHLIAIQRRREVATRLTQRMQVLMHRRLIQPILRRRGHLHLPFAMKLLRTFPFLQWIPARLVGIGLLPEHVQIKY